VLQTVFLEVAVAVLAVVALVLLLLAAQRLLDKDLLAVMLCGTAVQLQMVLLAVAAQVAKVAILLELQAHLALVVLV
jgi:hypothetical protein